MRFYNEMTDPKEGIEEANDKGFVSMSVEEKVPSDKSVSSF